eukprot:Opistho-1_new@49406
MSDLKGKVIVLTGASSGFGRGAAIQFAQKGATLVLAARREHLLEDLVKECENLGAKALAVPTDVSKSYDVELLAEAAIGRFKKIDIWVNDAGAGAIGRFTDIPLEDHIKVLEVDLVGTMVGSYHAMKQFEKQGHGTLINIASMLGKVPAPYYASYAAAKHGVVGLGAALRQELLAQNIDTIHVCTIMPMAMNTPFFEHSSNYTRHEATPVPPMDDAQKVIDEIVKMATAPKDEVPVGMTGGSNLLLHNVVPLVSEATMAAVTHRVQMIDAPAASTTSGALQKPSNKGSGIRDMKLKK